jgi:hypothetical protein
MCILSYNGFDPNEPCGEEGYESALNWWVSYPWISSRSLGFSGVLTAGIQSAFGTRGRQHAQLVPLVIDDTLYMLEALKKDTMASFSWSRKATVCLQRLLTCVLFSSRMPFRAQADQLVVVG